MDLFDNEDLNIDEVTSNLTILDLLFATCKGDGPESPNKKKQQLAIVSNYTDITYNSGISEIYGVKRSCKE